MRGKFSMSALLQRPRVPTKATQLCAEQRLAADCLQPTLCYAPLRLPAAAEGWRSGAVVAVSGSAAGRMQAGGVPATPLAAQPRTAPHRTRSALLPVSAVARLAAHRGAHAAGAVDGQ